MSGIKIWYMYTKIHRQQGEGLNWAARRRDQLYQKGWFHSTEGVDTANIEQYQYFISMHCLLHTHITHATHTHQTHIVCMFYTTLTQHNFSMPVWHVNTVKTVLCHASTVATLLPGTARHDCGRSQYDSKWVHCFKMVGLLIFRK